MTQGVGAVLRTTQRLFGVTNRHCIDVEVWQSLTPEQRIERHVSKQDIEKINETYRCNAPLGLTI